MKISFTLLLLVVISACSDSGNSQTVKPENQSPATSPFVLPVENEPLGSYELVNAYPDVSFDAPIYASGIPGESRILVVEQRGVVKVFADDPAVADVETVLDISDLVLFRGEQGLLGLAFDPAFEQNRLVYLHYSRRNETPDEEGNRASSIIASMIWDSSSDRIDSASQKIIMEVGQPYSNHNGGMIEFGPDNFLYIAMGDGGSGGDPLDHGQNRATLLGNILRIDVHPVDSSLDYSIPADNPFIDIENVRPEIYAYGLRNPFRFSFDRQSGELWLGDVGQNAREEINLIKNGGNYGWRVFEGNLEYTSSSFVPNGSTFEPPVLDYDHGQGASVIGGYVYRGSQVASLVGKYLYADYVSGSVWALEQGDNNAVTNSLIATASSPTSFGETRSGELLIVYRSGGLYKLVESVAADSVRGSLLSETGLFEDLATLTPAPALFRYEVNHPFWSDGAEKQRWLAVPDAEKIGFGPNNWQLPTNAVAVKHFDMTMTAGDPSSKKRLETRVLAHTDSGWSGFTYRWNQEGTDANLLSTRETEMLTITQEDGTSRQQLYTYPGRSDCVRCHTDVAGVTLGVTTPQLNKDVVYTEGVFNQLVHLEDLGIFDQELGEVEQFTVLSTRQDVDNSIANRARDYLDVNCAHCHQPGGPTGTSIDLRATVLTDSMNVVDIQPAFGDLGISDSRLIASGDRNRSVLWLRMQRLDGTRMPPLASNHVDQVGLELVGDWIDSI